MTILSIRDSVKIIPRVSDGNGNEILSIRLLENVSINMFNGFVKCRCNKSKDDFIFAVAITSQLVDDEEFMNRAIDYWLKSIPKHFDNITAAA